MNDNQINKWLEDGRTTRSGHRLSDDELAMAFKQVQPASHWKDRINTTIRTEDQEIVELAIGWYVGGGAEFSPVQDGMVQVTAPGYWVMIGA